MKIHLIAWFGLGVLGIFLVPNLIRSIFPPVPAACDRNQAANPYLTCGDKILLHPPGGRSRVDKVIGIDEFKRENYAAAIIYLTRDWNISKDPETSIALANAQIAVNNQAKFKTIAVVIPASQTPIFVPTSILKGIAQAQTNWNNDPRHDWKLRVVIADDANDPNQAQAVAHELVKRDDILAVIGHYSSQTTTSVRDIYQRAQTVLISGTSTATELTTDSPDTFFFRTCPSNRVAGTTMAQKWASKHKKIAIFYTPGKKFSESIRGAFMENLKSIEVVKEFNLSNPTSAKTEIDLAKRLGATGIVLFPDAYTDPIERDRVSSIIKANNGSLPILGNETVADESLFNLDPKLINNLTLSLVWHPSDTANRDPQLFNAAPNWWGVKNNLNARIVMSFDAMQVLLSELKEPATTEVLKDRKIAIQQYLSNSRTSITGITGTIRFKGSDRSQPINSLVQPSCNLTKCTGFKPVR